MIPGVIINRAFVTNIHINPLKIIVSSRCWPVIWYTTFHFCNCISPKDKGFKLGNVHLKRHVTAEKLRLQCHSMTETSNILSWRRQPRVNIQSPLCTWTKDDGQPGYLPRFFSLQWWAESFFRPNPKSEATSVNAIISGCTKERRRTKIKGTRLFFNK